MTWKNLLGLFATWIVVILFFVLYIYLDNRENHGHSAAMQMGLSFASRDNLETVFRQTTIVAFGAIGMTFVIVCGMIDLSVGSIVAFVTVAIAWFIERRIGGFMVPAVGAAAAGVLAGVLAGVFNGQLINRLKLSPFIVTLGSLLIFRGIAKGIANNQKIDAPMTWMADILARLSPSRQWQLFPIGVWLALVSGVLASLVLERTVFGRNVVAVGANEEAARLAGISPTAIRNKVFALAGLFVGLAGLMQFSRLTVGDPTVAMGLELDVIAAVVIGGASLSGGQGTIAGSLLGALVISTIRAGCSQAGFPNNIQEIVTGCIIIAALAIDRLRKRNRW